MVPVRAEHGSQAERVRGQERRREKSLGTVCSGTVHGESGICKGLEG